MADFKDGLIQVLTVMASDYENPMAASALKRVQLVFVFEERRVGFKLLYLL